MQKYKIFSYNSSFSKKITTFAAIIQNNRMNLVNESVRKKVWCLLMLALMPLFAFPHEKSIVILYENDVHCTIDGYAQLAGLRDAIMQSDTAWTAVVSSGDYLQGEMYGALSRGQYIIDIMRKVGYDAVTLGNHEFDYGVERMQELLQQLNAPVVCANYFKTGTSTPCYAPYTICRYGDKRIAFVGVVTPVTMESESFSFYDINDRQLYDLRPNDISHLVQTAVDKARNEGADYVVVLSHLGESQPKSGITSHQLVAATRGIDAVLDGHTHSVIPCDKVANLDGKAVPVTQTGTQFANVGKLVITADGNITTTLIPTKDITYTNATVKAAIDNIHAEEKDNISRKLCHSDYLLNIYDADGENLVRRAETNLGDLVTDAYCHVMQAEIGCYNSGGIRNGINAGTITYGDVINALPFNNYMAKIEATGAEILAMLKRCTAALPATDGQFPQVSCLRYTIHQKSHTISDVSVFDRASSTWKPLDLQRRYTVALSDYYLGGGFYNMLKGCRQLFISTMFTRDALAEYLTKALGGTIPARYAHPQGRITIVDD